MYMYMQEWVATTVKANYDCCHPQNLMVLKSRSLNDGELIVGCLAACSFQEEEQHDDESK